MPTTLKFEGDGFEWGSARFPTPEREEQDFGATKTYLNVHYGTPVLWIAGRKTAANADPAAIKLTLRGQTCNPQGCVPYKQVLTSAGRGSDALFAKFPADLVLPAATPVEAAAAGESADSAASPITALDDGHAHAELFVRADGDDVKVAIQIVIDAGFHLGHGPTEVDIGGPDSIGVPTKFTLEGDGFEWSSARFPPPERETQDFGAIKTWLHVHHGTIVVWLRGKKLTASADPAALNLSIKGQTCDANGCVPYAQTVAASGMGSDELFAAFPADLVAGVASGDPAAVGESPPQTVAPPPSAARAVEELPLGLFLLSAFGWGIFSLLMPCTYPMIPITISYFTKQAAARKTSILPLSLTYGAGIVLIYIVIGVAVGPVIIRFATHWLTNLVIGGFFIVFSLSLFGLILLQPPQFLLQAAGKATRRGGYLGVFLMGATLVITSFTCTAPFVGTLLAAGASTLPRVVMGMTVFGLTMAIPFVFLSLLPSKAKSLPKSGEWMHTLKVCLGFVEVAAALKFFSQVDMVLRWGLFPREIFLLWWAGLFLACALYLWGVIRLHEDSAPVVLEPGMPVKLHASVGPGRLVAGISFALFGLYCLHGSFGHKLDWIMTSLVPPYSNRIGATAEETFVVDDLDAAIAKAKRDEKLLLLNFTGYG
ncbi:MAG: hypothetical protein EXS13_01990 [Planctomycetes bacterium]|nr:hypothetical protein [Planctomycetota bacterium]